MPIQVGDMVTIIWANGEEWPNAKVLNRPRGAGDLWEFKVGGVTYAVNPYTPRLEYIKCEDGSKQFS